MGDDDALAARERLPHAPRRDARQRRLLRARPGAARGAAGGVRRGPGERVAIIGQSRGGVFARALAVRRPDLVSGIVTLGAPTVRQLSAHPLVLAHVVMVGALGTGRVPGMFSVRCLRGACCERFRADLVGALPVRRRLHRAVLEAPTASSTGAPAWTRRPSRSRSAPRTSGWGSTPRSTPRSATRSARSRRRTVSSGPKRPRLGLHAQTGARPQPDRRRADRREGQDAPRREGPLGAGGGPER